MRPVEELFHLAQDRIEMRVLTAAPEHAARLGAMRQIYDAQLDLLAKRVVTGHGHEPYPTLFSRTIPWEEKAPRLKPARGAGGAAKREKQERTQGQEEE